MDERFMWLLAVMAFALTALPAAAAPAGPNGVPAGPNGVPAGPNDAPAGPNAAPPGDRGIVNTSRSPYVRLRSIGMDDARWTAGFWADRFRLCRTAMIPSIRQALLDPRNSEQLANFRVAAGLEEGAHRGTDWSDGDCYKWLEAAALVYAVTHDPELDRLMDEWIEVIGRAQSPGGYISTNIGRDEKARLQMPHRHELYNMGHLLTAACIHRRAAGKDSFLAVALKAADFLDRQFRPRPPALVHFPWNPSAYMGLVELYRTTHERRYLELAGILIDNRGSSPGGGDHRNGGTDQTQDRVPLRRETEALGHAVCATYLWCGAADVYAETGERALMDALERMWLNVSGRKMYVTGAVGAGAGTSPRGDPLHEAFLADYQLPGRAAYAETCANIGNAMWNWRMLGLTGDARYADVMERVLYNSMLSAVSADGTRFSYCNPLAWAGEDAGPTRHHTAARWSVHSCYCCPPQVARTIAGLHAWAYGVSDDAVWVHLYGGSRLSTRLPGGAPVALAQETDYPWAGGVRITVEQAPARPLALMLRIPGWAGKAAIKVNGKDAAVAAAPGSYAALRRTWTEGDVIELDLPLEVRLLEAHPAVKELRDHAAVMRGPVVYCLEVPADQGGARIWQDGLYLAEDAPLRPQFERDFLGGMVVLKGRALSESGRGALMRTTGGPPAPAAAQVPSGAPWPEGTLYRPLVPRAAGPRPSADERPAADRPAGGTIDITLIPYFAWANRGVSFMEVWIPLAR